MGWKCRIGIHDYERIDAHRRVEIRGVVKFVPLFDQNVKVLKCRRCGLLTQQIDSWGLTGFTGGNFYVGYKIIRDELAEINMLLSEINNDKSKVLSDLGWDSDTLEKFLDDVEQEKRLLHDYKNDERITKGVRN